MVETDPQKIVTYTQDECRAMAAAKLVEDQTYLNDSNAESTQLAMAAALFWATLALSAPKHEAPAMLEDQTIPGVTLLSADSPEPAVNPGEILVDPSGRTYPYLLRLDGHKWLWCDSLAHAEATKFAGHGTWSEAMGAGLIRVRRATEREQIEFRNGTGGAALDLVRRLLSTLAGLARDSGHEPIALWLANCGERAHLSFHSWEWPGPAPSAPLPPERAQTDESLWHPGDRIVARAGEHGSGGEYSGTVVYPTPDQVVPMPGVVVYFLRDEDGELRWARPKNVRAQTDAKVDDERWRAGTGGGIPDYPRNVHPPGGGGAAQWREG